MTGERPSKMSQGIIPDLSLDVSERRGHEITCLKWRNWIFRAGRFRCFKWSLFRFVRNCILQKELNIWGFQNTVLQVLQRKIVRRHHRHELHHLVGKGQIQQWTSISKIVNYCKHTSCYSTVASFLMSSSEAPKEYSPISWENAAKSGSTNSGTCPKSSWQMSGSGV